ncbi:MAG: acyl-CoA dehydrogenase C-terminal domain-containing protein, partial [Actinomycetota bacterium]|nr:acyl-CoA dehydrogenase C-terminal domain-containing protein [Actinomycetota bacterium]
GLLDEIESSAVALQVDGGRSAVLGDALLDATRSVDRTVEWLLGELQDEPSNALAGASAFLGVFGDLVGGWLLAQRVLRREGSSAAEALDVAVFYATERLVTVAGRCATVTAGSARLFI